MEICYFRTISATPIRHNIKPSIYIKRFFVSTKNQGCVYQLKSSLRATSSEETSTESNQYTVEEPVDGTEYRPVEKKSYITNETSEQGQSTEDTPTDEPTQAFEISDMLDVKLDSEDTPSLLLLGGGSLVALWLATVLVTSIDSIPLFPKLMEVVGLGYTLWFGTRYLLFKRNREELVVKIEEIKQQVLGSKNDD